MNFLFTRVSLWKYLFVYKPCCLIFEKKSCNRHCCSLLGEIGSYKHICTLSFLGLLPLEDANGLIVNCVFSFPPTVVNRNLLGFLDCHTQGEAAHVPPSHGGFLPGGYIPAFWLSSKNGTCAQPTLNLFRTHPNPELTPVSWSCP